MASPTLPDAAWPDLPEECLRPWEEMRRSFYERKNISQTLPPIEPPKTPTDSEATVYSTPIFATEREKIDWYRTDDLLTDREVSRPIEPFCTQLDEELYRLNNEIPYTLASQDGHRDKKEQAYEIVKTRWKRHGIWNPAWDVTRIYRLWAYEQSTDKGLQRKHPIAAHCDRDEDKCRPLFQFINQLVDKTQQMILESPELALRGQMLDTVTSQAYHSVKSLWVERGIWFEAWEILPGLSWKHEHGRKHILQHDLSSGIGRSAARDHRHKLMYGDEGPPPIPKPPHLFLPTDDCNSTLQMYPEDEQNKDAYAGKGISQRTKARPSSKRRPLQSDAPKSHQRSKSHRKTAKQDFSVISSGQKQSVIPPAPIRRSARVRSQTVKRSTNRDGRTACSTRKVR